jgi:colicin import membrane protein
VKDETKKTITTKKTEMKYDPNKLPPVVRPTTSNKVDIKKDVKDVKTVIKDKEVGKTADGKTIYEGPKGGKYTLSASGKKVYITKDAKEVK